MLNNNKIQEILENERGALENILQRHYNDNTIKRLAREINLKLQRKDIKGLSLELLDGLIEEPDLERYLRFVKMLLINLRGQLRNKPSPQIELDRKILEKIYSKLKSSLEKNEINFNTEYEKLKQKYADPIPKFSFHYPNIFFLSFLVLSLFLLFIVSNFLLYLVSFFGLDVIYRMIVAILGVIIFLWILFKILSIFMKIKFSDPEKIFYLIKKYQESGMGEGEYNFRYLLAVSKLLDKVSEGYKLNALSIKIGNYLSKLKNSIDNLIMRQKEGEKINTDTLSDLSKILGYYNFIFRNQEDEDLAIEGITNFENLIKKFIRNNPSLTRSVEKYTEYGLPHILSSAVIYWKRNRMVGLWGVIFFTVFELFLITGVLFALVNVSVKMILFLKNKIPLIEVIFSLFFVSQSAADIVSTISMTLIVAGLGIYTFIRGHEIIDVIK